jgi:hypothetical protein
MKQALTCNAKNLAKLAMTQSLTLRHARLSKF